MKLNTPDVSGSRAGCSELYFAVLTECSTFLSLVGQGLFERNLSFKFWMRIHLRVSVVPRIEF